MTENGFDYDGLEKEGAKRGINFFMGAVTQALKSGNKIMGDLQKTTNQLVLKVNNVENKVGGQNQKFEEKKAEDIKLFDTHSSRLHRDHGRLEVLEKTVGIGEGAKKESRSTVTWIVGIAVFLVLLVMFVFNMNKANSEQKVYLSKDALQQLIKLQENKNSTE